MGFKNVGINWDIKDILLSSCILKKKEGKK